MGAAPEAGLVAFLDAHGVSLLMGELAVLAVVTFAAMGTDEYWTRRTAAKSNAPEEAEATAESLS
jgi:hypothetical protein